ncbi:MAG: hypothetical protein BGP16_12890 [Sphingobium sp. 66-54]|nr:MAG: hypothetical protein BGP16_12890 [Sphingobium sp. 66-54]
MTGFRYSPSTRAFYHVDLNAAIPPDALAVSDARHAELMALQSEGRTIVPDADGRPVAVAPPAPPPAIAMMLLRRRRNRLLAASDRTQIADFPIGEAERAAWADYRTALRALPETCGGDASAAVWPVPPTEGIVP